MFVCCSSSEMSKAITFCEELASTGSSSGTRFQDFGSLNPMVSSSSTIFPNKLQPQKIKKKRNPPGQPGDQFHP